MPAGRTDAVNSVSAKNKKDIVVNIDKRRFSFRKNIFFAVILAIITISTTVTILEIEARLICKKRATSTNKLLDYSDTKRKEYTLGQGGYLKENFNALVNDGSGHGIRWINNSQGFRSDHDFTLEPSNGVLRILSLGDSFTAGYRIPQGLTYSDLLRDWTSTNTAPCEILISCIDHPAAGFEYLRTEGYKWHPHIVLLGITLGNDITCDYEDHLAQRTPEEKKEIYYRLSQINLPDQCIKDPPETPGFSDRAKCFLYQHSQLIQHFFPTNAGIVSWYRDAAIPRMFDWCNGLGIFAIHCPEEIRSAYRQHFKILKGFKGFCESNDMSFAIMLFPQRYQVQPKDWQATVKRYSLNEKCFDLELPNKLLRDFCSSENILMIDITPCLQREHKKNGTSLYFPKGDMHWNQQGQYHAYLCVKEFLRPILTKKAQNVKTLEP